MYTGNGMACILHIVKVYIKFLLKIQPCIDPRARTTTGASISPLVLNQKAAAFGKLEITPASI